MVKCTYPLIALIKLDLPLPESPVIAMFTSTSRQFSSLFLKNSTMSDTPPSSISFLSSAISAVSHLRTSPMLKRKKCSIWSSKCCGAEVTAVRSASSAPAESIFVSLLQTAPLTKTQVFWICYDRHLADSWLVCVIYCHLILRITCSVKYGNKLLM